MFANPFRFNVYSFTSKFKRAHKLYLYLNNNVTYLQSVHPNSIKKQIHEVSKSSLRNYFIHSLE